MLKYGIFQIKESGFQLMNKSFLCLKEFPWFVKATVEQIYNLEFFHGRHLHWSELDIDIDIKSLKYPEAYPCSP